MFRDIEAGTQADIRYSATPSLSSLLFKGVSLEIASKLRRHSSTKGTTALLAVGQSASRLRLRPGPTRFWFAI